MENSARQGRKRAAKLYHTFEILSILFLFVKMPKNPNPKAEAFQQKEKEREGEKWR